MTVWGDLPSSLVLLFFSAAVGIASPLFLFPGLIHRRADPDKAAIIDSLRYAATALACALPGFFVTQGIVRLCGGSQVARVLLAPLALAALAGGIDRVPQAIPALQPHWLAAEYGSERLRLYVLASALALLPAHVPALQTAPWLRSLVFFSGSGCGLLLLAAVLGAIGERMTADTFPPWMRGTPAILVLSGLVALAWMAMGTLFGG